MPAVNFMLTRIVPSFILNKSVGILKFWLVTNCLLKDNLTAISLARHSLSMAWSSRISEKGCRDIPRKLNRKQKRNSAYFAWKLPSEICGYQIYRNENPVKNKIALLRLLAKKILQYGLSIGLTCEIWGLSETFCIPGKLEVQCYAHVQRFHCS